MKFSDDPTSNTKELNITAGEKEECINFNAMVKFSIADIFKPIDLNMNYVSLDGVPDTEGKTQEFYHVQLSLVYIRIFFSQISVQHVWLSILTTPKKLRIKWCLTLDVPRTNALPISS